MSRKVTTKQSGARVEIAGKLDGWVKLRSYEEFKDVLSDLIGAIKEQNPDLQEKYTKSAISFADVKINRNVFYIDYISRRTGIKLKCGFPSLQLNPQNEDLKNKIQKQLVNLDGLTLIQRETGDHQDLQLGVFIEINKLTEDILDSISKVMLLYAEGFGKQN